MDEENTPEFILPRQPVTNDPEFGFIRMLDGHLANTDGEEGANIHRP